MRPTVNAHHSFPIIFPSKDLDLSISLYLRTTDGRETKKNPINDPMAQVYDERSCQKKRKWDDFGIMSPVIQKMFQPKRAKSTISFSNALLIIERVR